jgi:hypothetical protein
VTGSAHIAGEQRGQVQYLGWPGTSPVLTSPWSWGHPGSTDHMTWLTHLSIRHTAVSTEVQGAWHSGVGAHRKMAVQAGRQAEGQAGPAAQEDVDGREGQGA